MSESNTALRVEFNYKFGLLSVYAGIIGIRFICTSYTRTPAEQNKLFREGKSGCDGYDEKSYHQLDRARDIVIVDKVDDKSNIPVWERNKDYELLGKFWRSIDGRWGGDWENMDFDDIYHFEY